MPVLDLLEGDLAVQFLVEGDEHRPETTTSMRSKHTETLAVAGGRADGVGGCPVSVEVARGNAEVPHGRIDLGVADFGQARPRRRPGMKRARDISASPRVSKM